MASKRPSIDDNQTPAKKPRYKQGYREEYTKLWPFILKSKREHHVLCSICNDDLKVSSGGQTDIRKHINTKRHTEKASCQSLKRFMSKAPEQPATDDDLDVSIHISITGLTSIRL